MLKEKIHKSDFLKHTLVLVSGTILAQLIPILLQPILRRVYTPEQFGLFAVYSSIFSMLVVVAAGKYETTIVVPKEDKRGSYLVLGSILISFVFSLMILFLFLLFNDEIIALFKLPKAISSWLYFIPISILFISVFRALNNWLIRKKQFKKSSSNKIARRASEGVSQVLFGVFNNGAGLIIGNIIGDFCNLIISYWHSKKSNLKVGFDKNYLKKTLLKYKDYPIFSALPSLLNAISLFLPVLIINKFYSQEYTGYFDLSRQMLALPLALISTTVSQVLLQKVAEQKNKSNLVTLFILKLSVILLGLSIMGGTIIYFTGSQIFSFIFGNEWGISGEIAQILVFGYGIKFIVSPLSTVFISLEKIKISSIWQIFYFGFICILFLLEDINIKEFLTYYVIIDICCYSIYYILILLTTKKYDRQLKND